MCLNDYCAGGRDEEQVLDGELESDHRGLRRGADRAGAALLEVLHDAGAAAVRAAPGLCPAPAPSS